MRRSAWLRSTVACSAAMSQRRRTSSRSRARSSGSSAARSDELVRVGREVEQLLGIVRAPDVLPAPAPQHHGRRSHPFGEVLDRHVGGGRRVTCERGREAAAVERGVGLEPAQLEQRRRQVEQRDRLGDAARRDPAGRGDDQRHARGRLEEGHLVPEPALAQHLAVVGGEEHDRVVAQAGLRERAEHLADALVGVADRRVVGVARAAHLLAGQLHVVDARHVAQPDAVRIGLIARDRCDRRRRDRRRVVEVPVTRPQLPRVVRTGERDAQEERPSGGIAREVVQLANCAVADLVVVVHLHRRRADPGRQHALHRVVPGQALRQRRTPVRRPVQVGGVDVGREPLLEAVQLVGADEVHLAAQARVVARRTETVRHGRLGGAQLGRVVVDADARREPAGEQRRA